MLCLLRFRIFEAALKPTWKSWLFSLLVVVGVGFLGWEFLRTGYLAILAESEDVGILQKAVASDPNNPEAQHRLGMILSSSLGSEDHAEGLRHLRRATEQSPYAARYWSDLAWARELGGDTAGAAQAIARAVKLSPMTPHLHWVAGNTLLRAGHDGAAKAEFRRLLELAPSYAPATFHLCLGAFGDPQVILRDILPPGNDPGLKLTFLNFLITHQLADQAYQIWVRTVETGGPIPLSLATPYLERLLQLGRFDEAEEVWHDLQTLGVIAKAAAGGQGNLVYNGDFGQTPLQIGFDWRETPGPYVVLDFGDRGGRSSRHCLRMEFTVSRNDEDLPVYQYVPVAPHQAYLLTANVRSQDITSDSGPRLQVVDPVHQRDPNLASDTTVGTTPWHAMSLKFCTGPETRVIRLAVVRARGRTFPMEITGSFWLGEVILKPLAAGTSAGCAGSAP